MLFHSWLRTLRTVLTRRGAEGRRGRTFHRQPTARFRPRFEALEDRCTPALLTVTTLSDLIGHSGVSLRDAISTANADAQAGTADTIVFNSGLAGGTITLAQGQLTLSGVPATGTALIKIDAAALAGGITIDGHHASRIFGVDDGVQAEFNRLTLKNGMIPSGFTGPNGPGGGIFNSGVLTLNDCTLTGNSANDGTSGGPALGGGAICNGGTMTLNNCVLSGNTAEPFFDGSAYNGIGAGGAICTFGPMTLTGCTLTDNSATDGGGAIYVDPTVVTIVSCTFARNSSPVGADLFNLDSSVTVIGSNLSGVYGTITDPIAPLITQVTQLDGLNSGQKNSLLSTLQAAQRGSSTRATIQQLNAFIKQVQALVRSHRLGEGNAASLIDAVDKLIDLLA